jgi:signal transduction histidine kinase
MAHPKLLEAILHPEDLPAFRENEQRAAESGKPGQIEFRIISKAGDERCIGHICRPVHDEEDRFIGTRASNRDITEQKRLQKESEQAHKMEAIGTLAGGVAHQFNNALSVIQGMLELLEEDFSDDDTISAYVGEMKEASGRMKRLTAQLLAYARGGKYRAETLSFNRFIKDTIPILHHGVRPDIAIETELLEKDVRVHVDQTQMQMMLSAVLTNASEAIEGSGRIRIRPRRIRVGADPAKDPPDLGAGDYVRITVSDEGRGMDEKTRSRMFEPFFTTKFQGRGLGMAAAFGIVRNHKGSISVASSPGKGTAVSIYLPAVEIRGGGEARRQSRQTFDISGL